MWLVFDDEHAVARHGVRHPAWRRHVSRSCGILIVVTKSWRLLSLVCGVVRFYWDLTALSPSNPPFKRCAR